MPARMARCWQAGLHCYLLWTLTSSRPERAMAAMLQMKKLGLGVMRQAYEGTA
jgi:hypothetical protein